MFRLILNVRPGKLPWRYIKCRPQYYSHMYAECSYEIDQQYTPNAYAIVLLTNARLDIDRFAERAREHHKKTVRVYSDRSLFLVERKKYHSPKL